LIAKRDIGSFPKVIFKKKKKTSEFPSKEEKVKNQNPEEKSLKNLEICLTNIARNAD